MKVFRLRLVKLLLLGFILANLIFFYYTWNTLLWRRISRALSGTDGEPKPKVDAAHGTKLSPKDKARNANKHIRKSITIVFYGHYNFEQDLRPSIERVQKHAILIDVAVLGSMPEPFTLPFPEMLYMQAKIANLSTSVFPQSFLEGRRLFASFHTKQRRMELRRRQFREMYKKLQIKRLVRRTHRIGGRSSAREGNWQPHSPVFDAQFSSSNFSLPLVTDIDLFGCERTTKSCIGTVYNNRPFYYYLGKHTPPCCLDKLRTTFNHVLDEFENVGIRYWLDNYALKSAIETNQLSPDAYDIDISFNVQDLERSNAMKKSQSKPTVDHEGFYWIKATDGHYFRVQFSKVNQVGVNLLPYEITGNEVHASGFFGWKAGTFSSDYLHPMSTVLFLGRSIMCPNNVLEYLEAKHIKVKSEEIAIDEDED
ncbi:uncharacterized protein LOC117783775 [Drosophila innubila]|uniref:uncharacterized protein LOC117783775 n=1 Tax=Drosophila innubila TaxID=198719 RepID=UPI00148E6F66|nr:uncharacterized protein LOC117783775 [Drosophila innubila]